MKFERAPGGYRIEEALLANLQRVELGSPDGAIDKDVMLVLTIENPIGDDVVKFALPLEDTKELRRILTKFFADHPHLEE